MKMGRKDPRSSLSKSVKGESPTGQGGKNPIKSAGPYETPGVGECCAPKRARLDKAPARDPVADKSSGKAVD
jgi:hypothetical protein